METLHGAAYGSGSGGIYLDDMNCSSDASALSDCTHADWMTNSCGALNDAAVVCNTTEETTSKKFLHWFIHKSPIVV